MIFKNKKMIIMAMMLILLCCHKKMENDTHKKEEISLRDINVVMEEHTPELMALPGVVGVYIGKSGDDRLCIRVMVEKKTKELQKKIPKVLEGHPVEIEETGIIRPLDKN
jgi:hypothetical protein